MHASSRVGARSRQMMTPPGIQALPMLVVVGLLALLSPACESFDAMMPADERGAAKWPAGVARGARVVEAGAGEIGYTASSSGAVWVVDATTGMTLLSRQIERGQRLDLAPHEDEIRLDEAPILRRELRPEHAHAIWFRASRDAAVGDAGEEGGGEAGKDLPKELRAARQVASGVDDLSFIAPADGRVFLLDGQTKQILYRADVRAGDRLRADASRNAIELERAHRLESAADAPRLERDRSYVIYFAAQ